MDIQRNVLLPSLVTLGNGICGFAALWLLCKATPLSAGMELADFQGPSVFADAAKLVLVGMLFDVFDGKVARMSGGSSALGAQLDSFCDLITFGLVPAVMMMRLSIGYSVIWQRVVWCFSLAYFLGAMLRLARFTAENEADEAAHLAFKGLPTPGAAGCIASLVWFYCYIAEFQARELQWISGFVAPETLKKWVSYLPLALPPLGLILGYTMVSNRLVFEHLGSRLFNRKHSFDFFVYLVFGAILVLVVPELILPVLFLGYLIYTPLKLAYEQLVHSKRSVADESRAS